MRNASPPVIQKLQGDPGYEVQPKPTFFPAGVAASAEFNDGDELTADIRKWNHEITQVGRGRFSGALTIAHTEFLQFYRAAWSPGFYIRGQPPLGSIAIGIQCGGTKSAVWHGRELASNEVIMLDATHEIDCQTEIDCDMLVVSFQADVFAQHAETLRGRQLAPSSSSSRLIVSDPSTRRRLLRHWLKLLKSTQQLGSRLCDRKIAAHIESESLEMLIASLLPPDKDAKMAERRRVALQARRYMVLNLEEVPTITDICRAVHAAERTLHLGFREAFGITPKRFLKALRLNAVRSALLNAGSESTVAELAYRWGFSHLSNFAADYCRMFGELPSRTLAGLPNALEREKAANC